LTIGSNCWDISNVKETGLLIDGRDYYLAFYRAASKAERYILICGWQFDSDVCLVPGQDAVEGQDAGLLDGLPFDLEEPRPEQIVYENSYNETDSFFTRGIISLENMFHNVGKVLG
jgi:phospholipase D1/2